MAIEYKPSKYQSGDVEVINKVTIPPEVITTTGKEGLYVCTQCGITHCSEYQRRNCKHDKN